MIEQVLIEYRGSLTAICVALIAALVAFAVQRRNNRSTIINKFIGTLSSDIAALTSASNSKADAFTVLEARFKVQHELYITVRNTSNWLSRKRLKKAWETYCGEEDEQEWWLPNEYSALQSNQLKNTNENTKQLAIHRLSSLIKICK